jgi:hypothetical protein
MQIRVKEDLSLGGGDAHPTSHSSWPLFGYHSHKCNLPLVETVEKISS